MYEHQAECVLQCLYLPLFAVCFFEEMIGETFAVSFFAEMIRGTLRGREVSALSN